LFRNRCKINKVIKNKIKGSAGSLMQEENDMKK